MDWEKNLIKEFEHWKVYLYHSQYYLGRVYLWAKREDALDLFEISEGEKREYFVIGKRVKEALDELFNPDLYNYITMNNETPHLHTHIIPRYQGKRTFDGIEFEDKRWGKIYFPYDTEFKIPDNTFNKIRTLLSKSLEDEK